MTLAQMLHDHPAYFHKQSWYWGESFLNIAARVCAAPDRLGEPGKVPHMQADQLPTAADLAGAFLRSTGDPIWAKYFWTRDVDMHGQRVYVGGVGREVRRFQIHRHLHITDEWGVPVWE